MNNDEWTALVDAEEGDDGLFVPVLLLFAPHSEEGLRVPLNGVYWTAIEAIYAGRQAISGMVMNK